MIGQGKPYAYIQATLIEVKKLNTRGIIRVKLIGEDGKKYFHSYGVTYQDQAKRELGELYEGAIGARFNIKFGVNGIIDKLERINRYLVLPFNDPRLPICEYSEEDIYFVLWDNDLKVIVGEDGGEPEDQVLIRDWNWVPIRLNKLNCQRETFRFKVEATLANEDWLLASQ